MIHRTPHSKLRIGQHEPQNGMNSGAPEWLAVVRVEAPVMPMLKNTNII
jgi:hypothetical protein